MRQFRVDFPDKIADQVDSLVHGGWFLDENQLFRTAIGELLKSRKLELAEEFQREDITWALQQQEKPSL